MKARRKHSEVRNKEIGDGCFANVEVAIGMLLTFDAKTFTDVTERPLGLPTVVTIILSH